MDWPIHAGMLAAAHRRPPTGPRLAPPSKPFPGSAVVGPRTVFDDPATFSVAAFERALAAAKAEGGGVVAFGPGVFDCTGISAQALANVRLVGAGKSITSLWCDFDLTRDFATGPAAILGVPQGRLELEDLSFDGWRAVLTSGCGHVEGRLPDAAILNAPGDSVGRIPKEHTAGMYCRRVAVRNSGRFVCIESGGSGTGQNRVANVFLHHCDIVNVWQAVMVFTDDPCANVHLYDCLFQDLVIPDDPTDANWSYNPNGIAFARNAQEAANAPFGHDIRAEHCTWDGVTCRLKKKPTSTANVLCLPWRVTGAVGSGNWLKNCRMRHLGFDSSGGSRCTFPQESEITYTKGTLAIENLVVETCALGGEALFSNKGAGGKGEVQDVAGERTTHLENVLLDGVVGVPAELRQDIGVAGYVDLSEGAGTDDAFPRGILGPARWTNFVWNNVHLRNATTFYGVLTRKAGGFAGADNRITNWTIENFTVYKLASVFRVPGTREQDEFEGVQNGLTFANIKLAELTFDVDKPIRDDGSLAAALEFQTGWDGEDPPIDQVVTVRDVTLDLTGSGMTDGALVLADRKSSTLTLHFPTAPTGEIRGIPGSAYARHGHGGADDTPPASGAASGADPAWMKQHLLGCHPQR